MRGEVPASHDLACGIMQATVFLKPRLLYVHGELREGLVLAMINC